MQLLTYKQSLIVVFDMYITIFNQETSVRK